MEKKTSTGKEIETLGSELEVIGGETGIVEGSLKENVDNLLYLAENIDRIIEAKNKIRKAIYKLAKPGDWVVFSGQDESKKTAEIGSAGAFRISSTIGFSFSKWTEKKETGTDEKGQWYRWEVTCEADMRGNKVTAFGRAGSRDKFFGKAYGEWKDLSDINEGDIKMAAIRGAMKEGVKVLMGLHHIPPEELKEAGVPLEEVRSYQFKSSGDKPSQGIGKISEPQRKRLFAITKASGKKEEELKKYLIENYKIEHTADILKKDYEDICNWAEMKHPADLTKKITDIAKEKKVDLKPILREYYEKDNLSDLTEKELISCLRVVENK